MPDTIATQADIERVLETMKAGFSSAEKSLGEIRERLDQINGRVRTNETDVAVLKDRDMRRLGGEQEDRHIERTEQMIARLIKEYGTPTSVYERFSGFLD